MYFLNGNGMELINSDYVERFRVVEHSDSAIVIASYNETRPAVTIGRYRDLEAAKKALLGLYLAISENKAFYAMDESCLSEDVYKPRNGHNGRKPTRHGGS